MTSPHMENQMSNDNETLAALESQFDNSPVEEMPITSEMMARRLVWDLVPHGLAQETIKRLHLPAVSDDVEEEEHHQAHYREAEYYPLHSIVEDLTRKIGLVQMETIRMVNPDIDRILDPDAFHRLAFTSAKAVITELLSLNAITYPQWVVVAAPLNDKGDDEE